MLEILGGLVLLCVVMFVNAVRLQTKRFKGMRPDERQKFIEDQQLSLLTKQYGQLNPAMICPHCQEKGKIRQKAVTQKKGISGGKAAAAVFTSGVSMLATGLSRKEKLTDAYCGNCKSRWNF